MNYSNLIADLIKALEKARSGAKTPADFFLNSGDAAGSNQMLLFMKPELTLEGTDIEAVAGFIFDKIESFRLSIESAFVISGPYIEKHGIIAAHYGIIDTAAHAPRKAMTDGMWQRFEEAFGGKREGVQLIGGVEYLEKHPEVNAAGLSARWLKNDYTKLGSGVYCQRMGEENLYLVNGFYPRLREHFTHGNACVVCFVLRGSTGWHTARNDFAGATAPEKALPGSVRNGLLARRAEFRLPEVSANLNGIHLSAGPVEAVVEILRFSSRHAKVEDLLFGKMLLAEFTREQVADILANRTVHTKDGRTTFFDLTEELDSEEALRVLKAAVLKS
ncbi:MAG: hypothetical protein JW852_03670 [Spirochaetales bacterium]|nr:hypothetical protein [Spirochaetales bacterium]